MMDMEKLSSVMRSFEEGTELIWGISYDNTMPMSKARVTIIIGK
jgi:cell division GTPase FtsZ